MSLVDHPERQPSLRPPVVCQVRPEYVPLSFPQQRLWFLHQLDGSSADYNLPCALQLLGNLDTELLQRAVNLVIERHEILRTRFKELNGNPTQVIQPNDRLEVPILDISGANREVQAQRVRIEVQREWSRPFDLAKGPLIRVKLLKLSPQHHVLV